MFTIIQERFPARTQALGFFFFTRVYRLLFYILNDNDALQFAQLLAHQELFAPTFSFVIQHLLSRILQIKKCRFV